MIADLWEFWDTDTWGDDTWGESSPGGTPSVLSVVGTYTPTIALAGRFED